ncbi:putative glutathione S-transferase C-terminal domain-containing protein isoform X2 [Apostichopus japonicus]|uniref:Putative glutathione S-transferase C-terminal domain-containing protein isoform X2 n=1 Tax=Stichopus japonicus TaxID=307972 RepID=A0A2G8LJX9_STIJA|nr:putative glutathione S-transferase C-terminal domain-containing protein isoform X2 [Apostichopus japonicus]
MWSLDSVKETAALCGVQELVFDCEVKLSIPDVKKPATVDYDHGEVNQGRNCLFFNILQASRLRCYTKARNHAVKRKLPSLLLKLEETIGFSHPEDVLTTGIDWSALPAAVSPQQGEVPADRLLKKHQQIENLVTMVMAIVQDGDTIVDFCSGGGHVGIILAYFVTQVSCDHDRDQR